MFHGLGLVRKDYWSNATAKVRFQLHGKRLPNVHDEFGNFLSREGSRSFEPCHCGRHRTGRAAGQDARQQPKACDVAEGVIPLNQANDLFACAGVFINWDAADDKKIQEYNYRATKEAVARAVRGEPKSAEVTDRRNRVKHPFAAV